MTGATGFIGNKLTQKLIKAGHFITFLARNPERLKNQYGKHHRYFKWDALQGFPPEDAFSGIEVVINLMGEGIANKRWSKKQKAKIHDTRVIGTKHLVQAIGQYCPNLQVFISTSAIGIYDHSHASVLTEQSTLNNQFLGKLCQSWEAEAKQVNQVNNIRLTIIRVGVVLGHGGALQKMLPPFKYGLGGKLGTGKQWMNWIHVDDVVDIYFHAITNPNMQGIYNAVAPNNVTNSDFSQALATQIKRPCLATVPSFGLKLLVGEFAKELLVAANVVPNQLNTLPFKFKYPYIKQALQNILKT